MLRAVLGPSRVFERVSNAQVPIVACFLADQADGSPFRVSVHSWERPSPSPALQIVTQHGKTICFEARVFVDGLCIAYVHEKQWLWRLRLLNTVC